MTECHNCGFDLTWDEEQAIRANDIDGAVTMQYGGDGHVEEEAFCSLACAVEVHGAGVPQGEI